MSDSPPPRRARIAASTILVLAILAVALGSVQRARASDAQLLAHAKIPTEDDPLEELAEPPPPQLEVPSRLEDPPIARAKPLPREQDLLSRARKGEGGRLVVSTGEGEKTLTVLPQLQERLKEILRSYETPYAAVVVMEPATGRVLAMVEHSEADPSMRGLPVKAIFPAASIFKVVTAAALLEAGVDPDDTECSHGGLRRISARHLEDTERDGECHSLAQALALSANAVFAKLTAKRLDPERLLQTARAFGFNAPIDFPIPVEPSLIAVPSDELGLARTGAGFGDAFLSPLHGAALAAIAANGGVWRTPILFEDAAPSAPGPRVVSEAHARQLTAMMEETVTSGTARRIFRERGYRVAGAVGKTGSLADKRPFRDYSWFVGFAPKEAPEVAVAAVIVNDPSWRIRATWLGREAMRWALQLKPEPKPQP